MMCDGDDDPDKCRRFVTKGLMCTSFLQKAKDLRAQGLEGVDNFILRCASIERQVPNLGSVFHWVQNPEEVFNQAVAKAQVDTGIKLRGQSRAMAVALQQPSGADS